jgi:predicted RNA-binding Zn-ribbon protein involved in translation (DUF1610 family)
VFDNSIGRLTVARTQAKYDGFCPHCGAEIGEGDTIYKPDDEWICEDCINDWEF